MADGDKVSISHNEMPVTPEPTISPLVEEEPAGAYQVRWKTLMAVFALSMANCCAAIANTVCSTFQALPFLVTVELIVYLEHRPIPSFTSKSWTWGTPECRPGFRMLIFW